MTQQEALRKLDTLKAQFRAECEEIALECEEEGFPSHGENWDLRCADLWESQYEDTVNYLADLAGLPE